MYNYSLLIKNADQFKSSDIFKTQYLLSLYIDEIDKLLINQMKERFNSINHQSKPSTIGEVSIKTYVLNKDNTNNDDITIMNNFLHDGRSLILSKIPEIRDKEDFSLLTHEITSLGNSLQKSLYNLMFPQYSIKRKDLAKIIEKISKLKILAITVPTRSLSSDTRTITIERSLNLDDLLGIPTQDNSRKSGIFVPKTYDLETINPMKCRVGGKLRKCIILNKQIVKELLSGEKIFRCGDAFRGSFTIVIGHDDDDEICYIHDITEINQAIVMVQQYFDGI